MRNLDLSPSTDHNVNLLLSDSEAIVSRELFTALRKSGLSAKESLKIVHAYNGYEQKELPLTERFKR